MRKEKRNNERKFALVLTLALGLILLSQISFIFAVPEGPSSIDVTANRTKIANNATMINTTGGQISTVNMTAVIQNVRWKAFIGWIDGRFTLDDAASKTIYDWSLSTVNGEVYATRNSSTINWGSIACAQIEDMENESIALNHSGVQDNITATFTKQAFSHDTIVIGGTTINSGDCDGALQTYTNNKVIHATNFQEVVLTDNGDNIVYSTTLVDNQTGYDNSGYDFQMIVPENGTPGFGSATPYYLYVELS